MTRPITNLKNYEEMLRKIKYNYDLKLSKLGIYGKILKSIDKEHEKMIKKADLLYKKRDIIVNLIFEEKGKFNQKVG